MKYGCLILLFVLLSSVCQAQLTKYRVDFRDKGTGSFQLNNPGSFLSARAIERRERYQIAVDSSDLPIPANYIEQIRAIPQVQLLNQSKWLNAVTVETSDAQALATLQSLSFVKSVDGLAARGVGKTKNPDESELTPYTAIERPTGIQTDFFNYGTASLAEIALHNGQFLHNIGLRGQGMQLAMLDGGFFNYTGLKAFDSALANNQFLSTWDFVDREASVAEDHPHGMMCLSTIVANIPGQFVGKAPKASFHLFRTEDVTSEYPIEEFNWVCAAERADSIGADIISSSLGYGYEWSNPVADYPYSYLNGDITMAARGADMAAAKGILVFNSAGNSGNDYWKMITTPADGDSVIAVGAVNSAGAVGSFSSYGPSADGRIKPDMASVGVSALVQSTSNLVGSGSGTSYACPNLAGLATCLWQAFPEMNNMQIADAMKKSSHRFANPDDRTGYGVPNMKQAFSFLLQELSSMNAEFDNCQLTLRWQSRDVNTMQYVLERKGPSDNSFSPYLVVNAEGGSVLEKRSYNRALDLSEPVPGPVQFRIKQVIDTSSSGYASILIDSVTVTIASSCPESFENTISITPNPPGSRTQLNLQVSLKEPTEKLKIQVINSSGQLLAQEEYSLNGGRHTISLTTAHRSPGIYFVRIFNQQKEWKTLKLFQD